MNAAPNAEPNKHTNYGAIVAAVAAAASLTMVFGVFRLQTLVAKGGDPFLYAEIARGFVQHGFTTLRRYAASLYPELIALVYRLGGNDFAVLLLQCLLFVGTCLVAFSLGRRLYNARTGLLAGLFCALHPMLLRYVADLHMETFLTFMCMLTVWSAVRFYERPTVANGILLGTVGMCATLTKGVMLPFMVVFGIVSVVLALQRRSAKGITAVIAVFVTMAVVLAPWTYRNYRVTGGRFVLLTPGTSDAFLRGYVFTRWEFATLQKPPFIDAEIETNVWLQQIARDADTVWGVDEVVDEANNARVAKHLIATRPFDTARKILVGLFTFWYETSNLTNSLIPASLALIGWALAVVGLRRAHREGRPSWLIWLPIIVLNVTIAALISLGRYSVPILPCLMILAAFGVDTLLNGLNRASSALAFSDKS
jgi:4-amino-4-deoxy-L-arabinose transferase-like glycosyltransferase